MHKLWEGSIWQSTVLWQAQAYDKGADANLESNGETGR